jgi:plastocyanin
VRIKPFLFVFVLCVDTSAFGADYTVDQKDKSFSAGKLTLQKGDTVNFRNSDPFFHNVFSLSDAKTFDLGSYPQGQVRSITFNRAGTVEVECAIHPQMTMTIEVK